jgi:hypothetical protein
MLYAGADAQVTGAAALRLHGLRNAPVNGFVSVLVPHSRQTAAVDWVRPHRTRRLDPHAKGVGRVVFTSVPRAILDAARYWRSERPIRALIDEAVHGGWCTLDDLRRELVAGPRQHAAFARQALRDADVAARPQPPDDMRQLLGGSVVLPPIVWNPTLRSRDGRPLPNPDGWIAEVDLGLEIDPWDGAMWRHAELARHGAGLLRFTPAEVRSDPAGVRRAVERAYVDRLRRGVRGALVVANGDG